MSADRVCVGAIAGSYGVRGDVRLKSFCAEPEAIARYGPLVTEDGRRFELRLGSAIKGGFAARLTGVASKEAADALRGQRLYAPRAALPAPGEDEYYHADLIGLAVHDTGGARLGTVTAVLNHGAGDIIEVDGALLLPFTQAVIPTVDLALGRIVADPPADSAEGSPPGSSGHEP